MSHLSPLLKQATQVCAERGQGSWLYDVNGKAYLDFTSGIGVTSTGHCHPTVVEAARAQVGKVIHAQYTTVTHPPMLELTDRLVEKMPAEIDAVAFSNSGSEAVEMALRLARQATGRANVIVFNGGFHGRTMAAASLTTSGTKVRSGFHPMMAGVVVAPFPHAWRYGWSEQEATEFCLRELDHIFKTQSAPDDTAAMLIEPVQGEYGYYPANTAFMQGLAERCRQHGILLICDEIQAGYGRTGKFWSHQHFAVQPDIVITAKGLASGFPLSAIAASEALMRRGAPGSQGGTYGANAVACAAALATLEVIEHEQLVDNAAQRGQQLLEQLQALQRQHPLIATIRGKGLMLGMEIAESRLQPRADIAARLTAACEQQGLLLLRCGIDGQIVRWLPPLVVSEADINEGVARFERALQEIAA
ncbi:aspartate aminotransferase family protein [Halopseudomonas phragmitis]|uniref:Aspartate aminotransferase family protein n=2 Tax=Pseudomonadaceae TaxID=135621 RepID=A0A1V0B4I1_9GAMM|nr:MULTISPECIES: aminotransferase class III-fold pyridoxal phosphate-dependent enzyme [Pseudomonadaceae]AQZ94801.1 aspartate aminotransferase family protein [Halopseudomonas phragmitis]RHW22963.1 aspartate aminotransferase family protein [Pseudomonas jilinensis]